LLKSVSAKSLAALRSAPISFFMEPVLSSTSATSVGFVMVIASAKVFTGVRAKPTAPMMRLTTSPPASTRTPLSTSRRVTQTPFMPSWPPSAEWNTFSALAFRFAQDDVRSLAATSAAASAAWWSLIWKSLARE
jgi:hypothetical protein